MILTFVARDEKEPIIFTFVTTTYNGGRNGGNGGGNANHELIAIDTPPYE
jgi:hypothetical protein